MDGAGNIVSYSNYYAFGGLGIKRYKKIWRGLLAK